MRQLKRKAGKRKKIKKWKANKKKKESFRRKNVEFSRISDEANNVCLSLSRISRGQIQDFHSWWFHFFSFKMPSFFRLLSKMLVSAPPPLLLTRCFNEFAWYCRSAGCQPIETRAVFCSACDARSMMLKSVRTSKWAIACRHVMSLLLKTRFDETRLLLGTSWRRLTQRRKVDVLERIAVNWSHRCLMVFASYYPIFYKIVSLFLFSWVKYVCIYISVECKSYKVNSSGFLQM